MGLYTLIHMRGSQELKRAGFSGLHKLSEGEGEVRLGTAILTHNRPQCRDSNKVFPVFTQQKFLISDFSAIEFKILCCQPVRCRTGLTLGIITNSDYTWKLCSNRSNSVTVILSHHSESQSMLIVTYLLHDFCCFAQLSPHFFVCRNYHDSVNILMDFESENYRYGEMFCPLHSFPSCSVWR